MLCGEIGFFSLFKRLNDSAREASSILAQLISITGLGPGTEFYCFTLSKGYCTVGLSQRTLCAPATAPRVRLTFSHN